MSQKKDKGPQFTYAPTNVEGSDRGGKIICHRPIKIIAIVRANPEKKRGFELFFPIDTVTDDKFFKLVNRMSDWFYYTHIKQGWT